MIITERFQRLLEGYEDVTTVAKRIINAIVEEVEANGMNLTLRNQTYNLNFLKSEGTAGTAFKAFKSEVEERLWNELPEASNYLDMVEPIIKRGWEFLLSEVDEAKESGDFLSQVENGLPAEVEVEEGDIVDYDYRYGTDYAQQNNLGMYELRDIIEDKFNAEIRTIGSFKKSKTKNYIVSDIEWVIDSEE